MSPLHRLILISGWAHDSSAMEDLRRSLENSADVSAVSTGDLWSAKSEVPSLSSYAQKLGKMIEKNGGQVFIAGWSLGGMIALEMAADRPDLVAGLVLISTTPKFCAGRNWTSGVSGGALRAMTAMLKHNPRGVFATFFKNVALPLEENEEAITLKIEKASAMNQLELSAGLEYLSKADLRNEAAKLNIPALVLHGKEDATIPMEAGMALKSMLPISEIRVYEKCGHGLPWQNPDAITEDINGFLATTLIRPTATKNPSALLRAGCSYPRRGRPARRSGFSAGGSGVNLPAMLRIALQAGAPGYNHGKL